MHRLLNVTTGYLKFTFACMLGATALFALTGLAITTPGTVAVVALLGVAVFLVVRMEWKAKRRAWEISARSRGESEITPQSIARWLAVSQITSLLFVDDSEPLPMEAAAIWVCQFTLPNDSKAIPDQADKANRDQSVVSMVASTVEHHQKDFPGKCPDLRGK